LNERGKKDAPFMGEKCKSLQYIPDTMISSHANRAMSTARAFRVALGLNAGVLSYEKSLYLAPEDTYLEVCFELDANLGSVMLFGHNPGITHLANSVSDQSIDNVPTCGVLVIDAHIEKWNELDFLNCKLIDFIYPKMF
jgi:phosphohistidine phosphatase